jgi:16S rRNA G966 N2-methylase RsmD
MKAKQSSRNRRAQIRRALAEDVEPMSEAAVVASGDVWRLGDHVLACADSQDAEFLGRLMGEHKAAVVFTDPPYNVKIRGNVSGLGEDSSS